MQDIAGKSKWGYSHRKAPGYTYHKSQDAKRTEEQQQSINLNPIPSVRVNILGNGSCSNMWYGPHLNCGFEVRIDCSLVHYLGPIRLRSGRLSVHNCDTNCMSNKSWRHPSEDVAEVTCVKQSILRVRHSQVVLANSVHITMPIGWCIYEHVEDNRYCRVLIIGMRYDTIRYGSVGLSQYPWSSQQSTVQECIPIRPSKYFLWLKSQKRNHWDRISSRIPPHLVGPGEDGRLGDALDLTRRTSLWRLAHHCTKNVPLDRSNPQKFPLISVKLTSETHLRTLVDFLIELQ